MTLPYTVAALADYWGTSQTFVYDQIRAGRLKAMRFGGKLIRIKPEAVEEYECQASNGPSESSHAPEPMERNTGTGASGGLTSEERIASRLVRTTERRQRPMLVTSGTAAPLRAQTR